MDKVPSGSTTSLNSLTDGKEKETKHQRNTENVKKTQDSDKKGLKRRGSLKGNKGNVRDSRIDNAGNGNKKGFVVQNQDTVRGEEKFRQSGAFYKLSKGINKITDQEKSDMLRVGLKWLKSRKIYRVEDVKQYKMSEFLVIYNDQTVIINSVK